MEVQGSQKSNGEDRRRIQVAVGVKRDRSFAWHRILSLETERKDTVTPHTKSDKIKAEQL